MKDVNGIVRLIVEIPVDIHRIFKEEAKFRYMTLRMLMISAFIEKLKRDHELGRPAPITGKWGYHKDVKYRRTVIEIPLEIHTIIKSEAALQHITIKEYITTSLIEKMKQDSQYQLNINPGGELK